MCISLAKTFLTGFLLCTYLYSVLVKEDKLDEKKNPVINFIVMFMGFGLIWENQGISDSSVSIRMSKIE